MIILAQDYMDIQEDSELLNLLSFDQIIFLKKAKLMYKSYTILAPVYLHELFQMRYINLANTTSNLRSVAHKNTFYHKQNATYTKGAFHIQVW